MWKAQAKTNLAKFIVDMHQVMAAELQPERLMTLTADVIASATNSDVGLVHRIQSGRCSLRFLTYSSVTGLPKSVRFPGR